LTKDELLLDVWGFRTHLPDENARLLARLSRLRSKLQCGRDDRFVVNVWVVGRGVGGGERWLPLSGLRGLRPNGLSAKPSFPERLGHECATSQ
jgi:hypothetical protein